MRTFSLSWTTSILRPQFRTSLAQRVTASERSCMLTQASNFTQGRRACGIGRPCARRGWLNPEVWNPEGVKVLGTLAGSTRFVEEVVNKRLEEEAKLWEAIPFVPDLQAKWKILLQCAGPRCHHMLRILPPSQSAEYAQAHDARMLRVMDTLLALSGNHKRLKWRTTLHPCRCGWEALGLRSAQRMAPAAYWASWADALHMIDHRLPVVAANVAHKLTVEEGIGWFLGRTLKRRCAPGQGRVHRKATMARLEDWDPSWSNTWC